MTMMAVCCLTCNLLNKKREEFVKHRIHMKYQILSSLKNNEKFKTAAVVIDAFEVICKGNFYYVNESSLL